MNEPLDELYLKWLYSQVGSVRTRQSAKTYWSLTRKLYQKEYVWFLPNDDNRAEDGKDLRYEFINNQGIEDVDVEWMNMTCSVFEMLIGLSRRLSFQTNGSARAWFWRLIENLQLDRYNDSVGFPHIRINSILDQMIWRTYHQNGRGGIFPLRRPNVDQRKVELWYQMHSYLRQEEAEYD